MLRKNHAARPPKVSKKATDLIGALDKLDKLKVNAITGEIIWPDKEEEEPIPSIHYEDQSVKESNDADHPAQ